MTDHAPASAPAPAAQRRSSLYRSVLSLGIAAIAATWLPFSFLYINALTKHASTVSATAPLHSTATTTAGQLATLTPVRTRTS